MGIALYVDDVGFITTDAAAVADRDLNELDSVLTLTLKKQPKYFLGMNIEYVSLGVIKLSSRTYLRSDLGHQLRLLHGHCFCW
jgi:hypothetical protein